MTIRRVPGHKQIHTIEGKNQKNEDSNQPQKSNPVNKSATREMTWFLPRDSICSLMMRWGT